MTCDGALTDRSPTSPYPLRPQGRRGNYAAGSFDPSAWSARIFRTSSGLRWRAMPHSVAMPKFFDIARSGLGALLQPVDAVFGMDDAEIELGRRRELQPRQRREIGVVAARDRHRHVNPGDRMLDPLRRAHWPARPVSSHRPDRRNAWRRDRRSKDGSRARHRPARRRRAASAARGCRAARCLPSDSARRAGRPRSPSRCTHPIGSRDPDAGSRRRCARPRRASPSHRPARSRRCPASRRTAGSPPSASAGRPGTRVPGASSPRERLLRKS